MDHEADRDIPTTSDERQRSAGEAELTTAILLRFWQTAASKREAPPPPAPTPPFFSPSGRTRAQNKKATKIHVQKDELDEETSVCFSLIFSKILLNFSWLTEQRLMLQPDKNRAFIQHKLKYVTKKKEAIRYNRGAKQSW